MSKEHTDTPYKFVSKSQNPDEKTGIHPEVFVTLHKDAVIKEIKHEEGSTVAKIIIELPKLTVKLKYDIYAWILVDSEAYRVCETALQDGSLHTIRVETQRVKKIAPDIPILELNTKALASESVRSIIAAVDNHFTSEALTDPKDDFKEAGAIKAYNPNQSVSQTTPQAPTAPTQVAPAQDANSIMQAIVSAVESREVRASVLDVLAAQALLAGVPASAVNAAMSSKDKRGDQKNQPREIIPGRPASIEAPTWSAYNSDGRYNIGQQRVGGALDNSAQIYTVLANKEMSNSENIDEIAILLGHAYMAIADQVQSSLYGAGWRTDRAATSHQKIRSLVRSVIAHDYEIPVELDDSGNIAIIGGEEGLNQWTIIVGKTVVNRYRNAINIAETSYKINNLPYPGKEDNQDYSQEITSQEPTTNSPTEPSPTSNTPVTTSSVNAQPTTGEESYPESYAEGPNSGDEDDDYPETDNAPVASEPTSNNELPGKNTGSAEERHNMVKNLLQETGSYRTEHNVERREKTNNVPVFVEDPEKAPKGLKSPTLIDAEYAKTAEYSGPEEAQQLKELLERVGYDITDAESVNKISLLLAYTFGPEHNKTLLVPKKDFLNFFYHYEAVGKEALIQSIEYINDIHQK